MKNYLKATGYGALFVLLFGLCGYIGIGMFNGILQAIGLITAKSIASVFLIAIVIGAVIAIHKPAREWLLNFDNEDFGISD